MVSVVSREEMGGDRRLEDNITDECRDPLVLRCDHVEASSIEAGSESSHVLFSSIVEPCRIRGIEGSTERCKDTE
jgi:hypothetical protein